VFHSVSIKKRVEDTVVVVVVVVVDVVVVVNDAESVDARATELLDQRRLSIPSTSGN